ncbi:MAG: immunoglobulin domain-containing protein [Sedimentisphaerales bacterium]|nr:immunoglobulin domain-containing protein [Sedimentisphaerales bacterium]
MKKKIKSLSIFLIVCLIGLVVNANAVVIYQDNFDGPTGTDLDGLAPDIRPGSEVWDAGVTIDADGEITYDDVVFGDSAYLPFTPESGHLYKLSVTMDAYEGGDWLGVGFTQSSNPADRFLEQGVYWWALSRSAGHAEYDQSFIGVRTNGYASATTKSADDIEIVLDTRNTPWTVQWTFDNGDTGFEGPSVRKVDVTNPGGINWVSFTNARCSGNISSFLLIDDYTILGTAWDPDPEPGTTKVGVKSGSYVDVTLNWKSGLDPLDPNVFDPNINNHLVYMDTCSAELHYNGSSVWDDNIPESGPDFNASVTFTGLAFSTTYFWRVNESVNNSGPNETDPDLRVGDIWSFTTIGEEPVITVQPSDLLIEDGDTAVFTVGVSSATTPHYQWYRSTDAQVGGDTTTGTDSNTLTIPNADMDTNDLWYYVIVSNSSSFTDTSEVVHLWFEREIGRWKLNNDLTDSSGMGWTAVWDASGDPCVAHQTFDPCHIEGTHSAKFYDDINAYITVPDSNDYFNNYVVGLTASAWVKVDSDVTGYDAIVCKHSLTSSGVDELNYWEGWTLQLNAGAPLFEVRHADVSIQGTSIADSKWHMVTAVYDVENSRARLYVDGLLAGTDDSISPQNAVKTPLDRFAIGTIDANDGSNHVNPFEGLIDDVRIFTYPMTSYEVADLYLEHVIDAVICIDSTNPEVDLTDDCKVGLEDVDALAASWLDCNLYPPARCNE